MSLFFIEKTKLYFRISWILNNFTCQPCWFSYLQSYLSSWYFDSSWTIFPSAQMICCTYKSTIFSCLKSIFKTFFEDDDVCHMIFSLKTTDLVFILIMIKLVVEIWNFFIFITTMERRGIWWEVSLLLKFVILLIFWLVLNIKFLQ